MRVTYFHVFFYAILTISFACQNKLQTQYDTLASFPEGKPELEKYLAENTKWQQGQLTIAGKVFISFEVTKDGYITDVKVVKGLCNTCDAEAIRLVKGMPRWTPATINGQSVSSEATVVVHFKL